MNGFVCWDKVNFEMGASQLTLRLRRLGASAGLAAPRALWRPLGGAAAAPLTRVPCSGAWSLSLCSRGRQDPARGNTLKTGLLLPSVVAYDQMTARRLNDWMEDSLSIVNWFKLSLSLSSLLLLITAVAASLFRRLGHMHFQMVSQ